MAKNSNNRTIAKNTLYMYMRMGVTMLVTLYTSRVILQTLGVEDYGIYNIVGSVVVAFSFLSGPLEAATQRFYNFELGKGNYKQLNAVFNHSLIIYILLSLILIVIIEVSGLWFINHKMVLPDGRYDAAMWAFQFSVLCFVIGMIRMPFEALIIAHEKMSFYAYISIVEVIFKLLIIYLLLVIQSDKLILYCFLQSMVLFLIVLSIVYYCKKKFPYIKYDNHKDGHLFKTLLSFSGWSLVGSFAAMTANQGLNILLNVFYGVVVNAAMGIASQVSASINQFVNNFQVAFRPQIIKTYAAKELDNLNVLVTRTSKYSFLMLYCIVCPLIFNIEFVLGLWLVEVPDYTSQFTILILIYALLETISSPMCTVVQATGNIRNYQIVISSVILCNIVLSYVFLKLGFSPIVVLVIKCILDCFYLIVRLLFVRKMVNYSLVAFLKEVLQPIFVILLLTLSPLVFISQGIPNGWMRIFVTTLLFLAIYIPSCTFIAMNKKERKSLVTLIVKKINHGK